MASPARSARLANNAKGFDTVVERTRGGVKMRHATNPNRFAYDTQVGAKWHFGNAPYSEAQEIDTAWATGDNAPYRRRMVLADYNAFAGLDDALNFDAGQIVKYQHASGASVTFQPQQLQWTNDLNQIQNAGDVATVGATVNDDILRWNNAFGSGRHFEWQTQTSRLSKKLIIDTLASLPALTLGTSNNPVLRLQFIFQKSAGVDIYVDGVLWNEAANNPKSTTGAVEFRSGADLLWAFMPAFAWDSGTGARPVVVQRVRKQGSNLFVEVRVPYSWIQSAVFPIYIDPTIDERVDVGGNDGWRNSGSFTATEQSGFRLGNNGDDISSFAYFEGITISAGSTITAAKVTLSDWWNESAAGGVVTDIFGHDADNPAAPTTDGQFTGAPRTTAKGTWTWASGTNQTTNTTHDSPDISSVIQELLDSYTLSNDRIGILFDFVSKSGDARHLVFEAYEDDTAAAPILHIEYTEAGGGGVDSASKRISAVRKLKPWIAAPILPDATLSQGDRQHAAMMYSGVLAQSGAISGSASITEGADTLSASGAVAIAGTAGITESPDTINAAGTVSITGTASITESADTINGSGVVGSTPIDGNSSITEGADTLSASGAVAIAGTAGITESPDTLSAAGTVAIAGSAGITEGADTLSAAGAVSITGTASITEGADTLSAAGTVSITGTASITEGADTLAGAGVVGSTPIEGNSGITEGADTLNASGAVTLTGTASITEGADTLSASGAVSITGTAGITESPDTLSAAGTVTITGTASITESADTLSAAGTVSITGTASITEGADTLAGAGVVGSTPIDGTSGITEGADTISASGKALIAGSGGNTESGDTSSSSGGVAVAGTVTITESGDIIASEGFLSIAGTANLSDLDTIQTAGTVSIAGLSSITESSDTLTSSGTTIPYTPTAAIFFPLRDPILASARDTVRVKREAIRSDVHKR